MPDTTATTPESQATAEADPLSPLPEVPDENWKDEVKQKWFELQIAERAWQLDKWDQQQKRVFKLADMAAEGTIGKQSTTPDGEDSDVGVSVGNKVYNYYQSSEQNATATAPAAPPTANPAASVASAGSAVAAGVSKFIKPALIGASLLGGGGLGGVVLTKILTTAPAPVVTSPNVVDTDTDTNAGLRFKN